ncbi:M10 family metallopeptidase [Phenylobacterium sp.]|uniref:M10 family metallopeptidase n=1 Tax=Phenylobacterium sp. TaxID=1871053 RepID=UPI003983D914
MTVSVQTAIDALGGTATSWAAQQITFSIPGTTSAWAGYQPNDEQSNANFGVLNATQAMNFRAAIGAWDGLIARSLVETNDLTSPGAIRVAFTNVQDYGVSQTTAAYAYEPTASSLPGYAGDVWIDEVYKGISFSSGSYEYTLLLHELGHSLGLKHPHEGATRLPSAFDNERYTVMSYNRMQDGVWWTFSTVGASLRSSPANVHATTPMQLDVIAIQSRYGADTATNGAATTYSWSETLPILENIYDTGGTDLIDLSAHTRASIIDLTPGAFSSIARYTIADQIAYWNARFPGYGSFVSDALNNAETYTWTNNVSTSLTTVIENVIAGSGSDTITGNSAANALYGRAGNDILDGGLGNDTLDGGIGNDTLNGGVGNDTLTGEAGSDNLTGGAGADRFVLTLDGNSDFITDFDSTLDSFAFQTSTGQMVGGAGGTLSLNKTTRVLSWDADGDGAGPAQAVATGVDLLTGFTRSILAPGFQPARVQVVSGGGREEAVFDWGTNAFDRSITTYDAGNRIISFAVTNDDGSNSTRFYDNETNQPWSLRTAEYDGQGRLTGYSVTYDAGETNIFQFDPGNTRTWDRNIEYYDRLGRLSVQAVAWDDGTASERYIDTFDVSPWAYYIDAYRGGGLVSHTFYNADGSLFG